MSLSNIDKKHLEELCLSLNTPTNATHNQLEMIKANHIQYARLKQIAKDIERLRLEAVEVIHEAASQTELHEIKHTFRLTSGNTYYVYEKHNSQEKHISLISPEEWNSTNNTFIGKYYYDYDKQFVKIED